MRKQKLPRTDSIQELAHFWDTHDLTEFENELEVVSEAVFEPMIPLSLKYDEAKAVRRLAKAKGVPDAALIRSWVQEKIHTR